MKTWDNKSRANAAEAALEKHSSIVAGTYTKFLGCEEDVTDLLTDLWHYCEREKINFRQCNKLAWDNFKAEGGGEL